MRSTGNLPKTVASALEELGAELGISGADFGGEVKIDGKDPVVASRHHLGESTSVLLALFGMELAAIWKQRTGRSQDVKVDVRNAVCNLAALFCARHDGITVPFDDVGLEQTADFFRCKDGRWVYIVCSLPHLRQRACAVLGCQATRESFVDADVWVNSYLHLDRKGVSPQTLATVKPGIVCVEMRGYGFRGAWAERGGFEQHGQSVTGFSANEGAPDSPRNPPTYLLNDVMTGVEGTIGMLEALRRRAREGGSYLVRVTLARNCSWLQDFGLFAASEVRGVGLPESMLASPGLNARLRPEFDLPTVTSTGPLGEMSVLPPQVELSEFKLGPRFSGDPNGASKLEWSVFARAKHQ